MVPFLPAGHIYFSFSFLFLFLLPFFDGEIKLYRPIYKCLPLPTGLYVIVFANCYYQLHLTLTTSAILDFKK